MRGADVSVSDEELSERVRHGDGEAFRRLYERHRRFARQLAQCESGYRDVDDIVAEAFLAVYVQLRAQQGPREDFRSYLRRVVVHEVSDHHRHRARNRPDAQVELRVDPAPDHAAAWFESITVARAFGTLPQRWRRVLWYLEIEGRSVREVARVEGVTAARISAVAYRARRGLRAAYLSACLHPVAATDPRCRSVRRLLPEDVRGATSSRQRARVLEHLRTCAACAEVRDDLVRLDQQLEAWMLPVAGATAAGLAGAGGGVAVGVLGAAGLPLLGWVTFGIMVGSGGAAGPAPDRPVLGGSDGPVAMSEAAIPVGDEGDVPPTRDASPEPAATAAPPAACPPDPPGPASTTSWTEHPPQPGDRFHNGSDTFVVSGVEREESTESVERPVEQPGADGERAPGEVVWFTERTDRRVVRYTVELELENDAERYYQRCDGTWRERGMRMLVEETRVVVHREGYRLAADGTWVPVSEEEEIERTVTIAGVLTDPPEECAPEPEVSVAS